MGSQTGVNISEGKAKSFLMGLVYTGERKTIEALLNDHFSGSLYDFTVVPDGQPNDDKEINI